MCKVLIHPPLNRIFPGADRYHSTIVLQSILYRTRARTSSTSSSCPLANVCSGRSSPIMILENTIHLTEIQLRCRTSLNPSASKVGGVERMRRGSSTRIPARFHSRRDDNYAAELCTSRHVIDPRCSDSRSRNIKLKDNLG